MLEANGIPSNPAEGDKIDSDMSVKEKKIHTKVRNLKTMFLLATAYSSNIGGTGVSK
jgi:hypothetical protein